MTSLLLLKQLRLAQNPVAYKIKSSVVIRPCTNTANRALDETVAFDKAIRETMEFLAEKLIVEDTLVIVTADHSHAFTMAGYPARGTYLGFTVVSYQNESFSSK